MKAQQALSRYFVEEGLFPKGSIVDDWVEEQAAQVYDLEIEIMEWFPDTPFDFYLVSRQGRPIETLLRSASAYIVTRDDADNG